MILSIIVLLLVLVIAFWHYLQGFFSSTISAVLATVSVLVTFGYFESVVAMLKPGKFADSAHSMVLLVMFGVVYIVLRLIFDKAVPGNVRVPSTVDKIGGGVMGLIVGMLVAGLVAVAAQAMPLGVTVAGHARKTVKPESDVVVKGGGPRDLDRKVYDEMVDQTMDKRDPDKLVILPADDFVVGFVSHASSGSMSGNTPWVQAHPDYITELFGNRIGIQTGAKRSAQPIGEDAAKLLGLFTLPAINQMHGELSVFQRDALPKQLRPEEGQSILIARIEYTLDATDTDRITRVSPGSVRLVAPVPGRIGEFKNYFPIGTVEGGTTLLVNKPDDYLFIPGDKAADFLFVVDSAVLPDLKQLPAAIPANAKMFIETKRYARFSLAGLEVNRLTADEKVAVMRKPGVIKAVVAADPEAARRRVIGTWTQAGNVPSTLRFNANGRVTRSLTIGGRESTSEFGWTIVDSKPDTMTVEFTAGDGKKTRDVWTFTDADHVNVRTEQGTSGQLTRQK